MQEVYQEVQKPTLALYKSYPLIYTNKNIIGATKETRHKRLLFTCTKSFRALCKLSYPSSSTQPT